MPKNAIFQQDCLEGLRSIPDGAVDLAFADPPFALGLPGDRDHVRRTPDEYLEWSGRWIGELARVLKPNGTFWLAAGDEFAAELKIAATRNCGFICRNWVIWHYTFGMNSRHKFARSHTHLFYFVKDENDFTFNDAPIRIPSARQQIYGDPRANPAGRIPDDTWILRPKEFPAIYNQEQDVWCFSRTGGAAPKHSGRYGSPMPELLMARIIETSSRPGELVLDPFLGSGTTAVTAKKLNRGYLGYEISAESFEEVRRRLEAVGVGDPLDGELPPKPGKDARIRKRHSPHTAEQPSEEAWPLLPKEE